MESEKLEQKKQEAGGIWQLALGKVTGWVGSSVHEWRSVTS